MRSTRRGVARLWTASCWMGLVAALACTPVRISDRHEYAGAKLPRPGHILVHDFAATPADLPPWSQARAQFAGAAAPQTPEQREAGRRLGMLVAAELVERIAAMGLPALRAGSQPEPRSDDIVLVGYFASIDAGSTLKRVVIGFGSGGAELHSHVEGYRMTESGLQQLGSGELDSAPGKGPGVVVPVIVTVATANPIGLVVGGAVKAEGELSGRTRIEGNAKRTAAKIADELRKKFEEQGWIGEP